MHEFQPGSMDSTVISGSPTLTQHGLYGEVALRGGNTPQDGACFGGKVKLRRRINPFEGAHPQVIHALKVVVDHLKHQDFDWALVGGLAISFNFPLCPTDDVDIAVLDDKYIPVSIPGMKKLSPHVFQDNVSKVVVDFITAKHVNVPEKLVSGAIKNAIWFVDNSNGYSINVATPLYIFGLKLARCREKDKHHMIWMMRHGYTPRDEDLISIGVTPDGMRAFVEVLAKFKIEKEDEEKMGW